MARDSDIPAWRDGALVAMDKLAVHRLGLRHPAGSVFVLRGGDVLLQRRAAGKYHTPGLWANTCCTHPHWGEAAADCAARRLREELGIAGLLAYLDQTDLQVWNGLDQWISIDLLNHESYLSSSSSDGYSHFTALHAIPEPGYIAFTSLALGALLLRSRRRR